MRVAQVLESFQTDAQIEGAMRGPVIKVCGREPAEGQELAVDGEAVHAEVVMVLVQFAQYLCAITDPAGSVKDVSAGGQERGRKLVAFHVAAMLTPVAVNALVDAHSCRA